MIGRFLGLAVAITAVSVGVASIASRSAGDDVGAPATAETQDNSNWTTQRGKRGGRSSGSSAPGATASGGEVRLGRSGDSHFYADTEVDGTNIRMMVDSRSEEHTYELPSLVRNSSAVFRLKKKNATT